MGASIAGEAAKGEEKFVAGDILAGDGQAAAIACDVTKRNDVARVVPFAVEIFGRFDLALNNAPKLIDTHEIDPEDWLRVIEINLTGIFNCMEAEISHFLGHGGGAIVNMASTAGLQAHPQRAAYSASKHGIIGLTRTAAVEYASRGIRINAVAPGPIAAASAANLPEEVIERIAAKTAMGRMGRPEEVTGAIAFLLSDEASFVTGSLYEINGGQIQLERTRMD